ncbi:MAG: DNA-binding protein [Thermomicrobiales bacterium]
MTNEPGDQPEIDLPHTLSNPARQALLAAGYVRLEQIAGVSAAEILQLHGMGPKGIEMLRRALDGRGLSFAGRRDERRP